MKSGVRRVTRTNEREFVREAVSKATGVRFEVVEPHPGFPLSTEKLDWFMRCRNKEEIRMAPYLNTVWKERRVGIWLESLAVGDTVDWIELAYGEERVNQSLDLDYSRLEDPSFERELEQKFPIVMDRIRRYEDEVSRVARKRKVKMKLRRVGSKGILVFSIAALVEKRATLASLGAAVEKSASAMREAYASVSEP